MNQSSLNTINQTPNTVKVERFMILGNGSCCGIFYQHKNEFVILPSRIHIVLSKHCEFIYIYYNNHEYKHKTRFIPMKFQQCVQKMIQFINYFVDEPYLTKRFINKSSLHYNNLAIDETKDINYLHHFINQYNWKGIIVNNCSRIGIYLCPLQQRLCIVSNHYIKEDDTCIEIPLVGNNLQDFEIYAVARIYSVSHLPLTQEQLMILFSLFYDDTSQHKLTIEKSAESYKQQQQIFDILCTFHDNTTTTTQKHSITNNSSHNICDSNYYSSAEAESSINDLIPCLSLLGCNSDIYPSSNSATTSSNIYHYNDVLPMVEYVDGDVYLMTTLDVIDSCMVLEVQCWIMSSTLPLCELVPNIVEEHIEIVQSNKYVPKTGTNNNSNMEIPKDVILALKDDYFTIIRTLNQPHQSQQQVDRVTFHHSYLQYEMNRRGGCNQGEEEDVMILVSPQDSSVTLEDITTTEESKEKLNINTFVHLYYIQLVNLYKYREYLLSNRTILVHRYNYYKVNKLKTIHGVLKNDTRHKIQDVILNPSTEPIHLATNYGTFTAICKQCSIEESKLYQITINLHDYQQHSISYKHPSKQLSAQCITTVRGVFNDHLILKFDIALQCFYILIPDGTEFSFTLQSYLNTSHTTQECTNTYHSINHSSSIVLYKAYIQKILSFYQYCLIPPEKRDIMTIHRENTSRIARASILNIHRYLLMQQIVTKQLTSKQAYLKSCEFENHLSMDANNINISPVVIEKNKNKIQFSKETMKLLSTSQAKRLQNKMNPILYDNKTTYNDNKDIISNNNMLLVQEGFSYESVLSQAVIPSIPSSSTRSYSFLTSGALYSSTNRSPSSTGAASASINTDMNYNTNITTTDQSSLQPSISAVIAADQRYLKHMSYYHKVTPSQPNNILPLHATLQSTPPSLYSDGIAMSMNLTSKLLTEDHHNYSHIMITPTSLALKTVVSSHHPSHTSSEQQQHEMWKQYLKDNTTAITQIQIQADKYAGNYIYENISMNNASNKSNNVFFNIDANIETEESNESLYSSSRINPTTSQYLKETYVQNALDYSKQVLLRNQEYLQYRSSVPL